MTDYAIARIEMRPRPLRSMTRVLVTSRPRRRYPFALFRVGGITFLRVMRLNVSFSVTRK